LILAGDPLQVSAEWNRDGFRDLTFRVAASYDSQRETKIIGSQGQDSAAEGEPAVKSNEEESLANGVAATADGDKPAGVSTPVKPETTEAESASLVESKPQGDSAKSEAADEQIVQNTKELNIDEEDIKTTGEADPAAREEDVGAASDEPAKDDMKEGNVTVRRTRLDPPRTLETTMFDRLERMYGAGIKRLLAVQYR
jgi:hypothetical protein